MKTPFLGAAYALRSLPLAAQTCINLYPEVNESKAGDVGAFYGTPGLTQKLVLSGGEGRGLAVSGSEEYLYAVCGANVYRIDQGWQTKIMGALPNSTGRLSTTSNNTQTVFAHATGWHYTDGALFGAVSGSPTDSVVTYMDGVVLFTNGDGEFGITALNDLTTIDPLDVAEAEALPDRLLAIFADQREVWLFGPESTEIWADTGAAAFPYERIPGGVLSVGCLARYSTCYLDGSVFWLARDRTGTATVLRTVGYQTDRVSTHALEHALEQYAVLEDAFAFGYQSEGHAFYFLTFPSADVTWVYDAATKLWHRRAWRDMNGLLHRHRANAYAFFNGEHCVLDYGSSTLYVLDLENNTDNGNVIYRERAWPLIAPEEMHRLRCDSLELVGEYGIGASTGIDMNPTLWLQMSYDGGQSFGYERYQKAGPIGGRYHRARWRRNGLGRRPVARIATTSTRKVAWIAANVEGEILAV